jgi:hypothetical protein
MQGRKILQQTISGTELMLPVHNIASGIYQLQLTSKEGLRFNERLVKQ